MEAPDATRMQGEGKSCATLVGAPGCSGLRLDRGVRIFITGIAGTAMGSLAGLLVELGHEVSGSDTAFYPPMGPLLERLGVALFSGFRAEHVDLARPELHIVGNVCRRENVEVLRAEELGIPKMHVADALAQFVLTDASALVVAGTHGKTTTSALCVHLLEQTGFRPGFFIGGVVQSVGVGYRALPVRSLPLFAAETRRSEVVRGRPFVLEGDEYDTAFWEKTAKFLHYRPEVGMLTSIEHDHIDIYPDFELYSDAFRAFTRTIPSHGALIACASHPEVVRVAESASCPVYFYGLEGSTVQGVAPHFLAAPALEDERGIVFDLFVGGCLAGRFRSPLAGLHNLQNAVGAIAAASMYGAPLRALGQALDSFVGVKRRQELRGTPGGVRVYDDFAHHPTAVQETLRALRGRHKEGRLIAVFEPRSATACRNLHQEAYATAFESADVVFLAPLGRSGLLESEALDVARLANDLRVRGQVAEGPLLFDVMIERICQLARPGDSIAVLSNGSFGGIFERLLDVLGHGSFAPPSEPLGAEEKKRT